MKDKRLTAQDIASVAYNRFMRRYWVRLTIAWVIGLALMVGALFLPVASKQAYALIYLACAIVLATLTWYAIAQHHYTKKFKALYKNGELY